MDTYFTVFKAQGEALLTAIHNMIKAVVSAPEVIEDLDDVDKNHVRAFFNNLFNTIQWTAIDTNVNSGTFGQVTRFASMRTMTANLRFRF